MFFRLRTGPLLTHHVQNWKPMVELVGARGMLRTNQADGAIAHHHVLVRCTDYIYYYKRRTMMFYNDSTL